MNNIIFKTFIIILVSMALPLTTNAAVSVSDGSAFVTKAEFSADLNNLSNRMALLENSLDAKIDSLVSSYLTRNGIWNGAKQDLNVSSWYLKDSENLTTKNPGSSMNQQITGKQYRVVNELSKTGLCTVLMSQKSTNADRIFGMWSKSGTTWARVYDSSFALFGYFTCEAVKDNATSKIAYAVGSGYGKAFFDGTMNGASQSFGLFTQTTEVVSTYYFFVNKGNFLDTYFHCAYYVPTGTAFDYTGQRIDFSVKSIYVY